MKSYLCVCGAYIRTSTYKQCIKTHTTSVGRKVYFPFIFCNNQLRLRRRHWKYWRLGWDYYVIFELSSILPTTNVIGWMLNATVRKVQGVACDILIRFERDTVFTFFNMYFFYIYLIICKFNLDNFLWFIFLLHFIIIMLFT